VQKHTFVLYNTTLTAIDYITW